MTKQPLVRVWLDTDRDAHPGIFKRNFITAG